MDGIYFYWFSWIGWIYTTFLMKKYEARFTISFAILLVIIGSNSTVQFAGFSFRLSFLFLLLVCTIIMAKTKGIILYYYIICSLILSIGYVSFHLFELFDPIWLIIDRKLMLSIIILYLVLMLVKGFYYRLTIAIIGVCNGEFLYSFILNQFSFQNEIGSYQFLDIVVILIVLVIIWCAFERLAQLLETNLNKGKAGMQ